MTRWITVAMIRRVQLEDGELRDGIFAFREKSRRQEIDRIPDAVLADHAVSIASTAMATLPPNHPLPPPRPDRFREEAVPGAARV